MSNQTTTNNIIERFTSFVEQKKLGKKPAAKDSEAFKERLSEMSSSDKDTSPRARRRGGSRHRPPKVAKLKERPAKPESRPAPKLSARKSNISMKHAQRLAKYAPLIENAARKHNVPVELICGVILQESGGNPRARSHCGARGLMQLMPATARRFGVRNSYNPAQNIEGGTKYLRFLLDRFDGNVELALAGYNAGEGAVEKHGNKIPPYKETQKYVPAVLSYTQSIMEVFQAKLTVNIPDYARKV